MKATGIDLSWINGMANNATVEFGSDVTIGGNSANGVFYTSVGNKVSNDAQVAGETFVYHMTGVGADNAGGFLLQ